MSVAYSTKVEQEGSKDFADILGKRSHDDNTTDTIDINENSDKEDNTELPIGGAFRQPMNLAAFTKASTTANALETTTAAAMNNANNNNTINCNETITTQKRPKLEDRMQQQLCKQWLKHNFLQLGANCSDSNCYRKHEIDTATINNPERIYRDFAFRGLSKKQRTTILSKLNIDPNAATTSSASIDGDGDDSDEQGANSSGIHNKKSKVQPNQHSQNQNSHNVIHSKNKTISSSTGHIATTVNPNSSLKYTDNNDVKTTAIDVPGTSTSSSTSITTKIKTSNDLNANITTDNTNYTSINTSSGASHHTVPLTTKSNATATRLRPLKPRTLSIRENVQLTKILRNALSK